MEVECLALKDLASPRKSESKENLDTVWRKSTPTKSTEPCVPAMKRKGGTPDPGHATPIKHPADAEPWSPMANLKMLIHAASPDIRNREIGKALFPPVENESGSAVTIDNAKSGENACKFEAVEEEDVEKKQKSLGLLCQNFLACYPDYVPPNKQIGISLDEGSTSFGPRLHPLKKMEVECHARKDFTSPRKREQKENIFTVWRKSTPTKSTEPCVPATKRKARTPDPAHVTPIKHPAEAEADPWSPTDNLKMLIKAASPDIRNHEIRKAVFRPIENESGSAHVAVDAVKAAENARQFEAAEDEEDGEKKWSRKRKSLGLLCQKFLALYPANPPPDKQIWISLDEVSTSLGVGRRRIYDIVNVMESLTITARMAKNTYLWYGRQRLKATLQELQRLGHQQGYHRHLELTAREGEPSQDDDDRAPSNRKDKSLRIMSQKFVMLFLVSKDQIVTLEAAARVLIEKSHGSSSLSKSKTKMRRIYDITNVLTSLGLIKKVHMQEERRRRPAFKWLGLANFHNPEDPVELTLPESQDTSKAKFSYRTSFNITPTPVAVHRQVCSAPSSDMPREQEWTSRPLGLSRNTGVGLAVCEQQFGSRNGNLQPTLLVPTLHTEHVFALSSPPPCLTSVPGLPQGYAVTLYKWPNVTSGAEGATDVPATENPAEGRKRHSESVGGEQAVAVKRSASGFEQGDKKAQSESNESGSGTQTSHYFYVANNTGLKGLNFLVAYGQPLAHLPSGTVPQLPQPYVLVPSSAPLPLPFAGHRRPDGLQSNGPAPEVGRMSSVTSPPTLEQDGHGASGGAAHRATTPQPPSLQSPKEIPAPAFRAFFQTPSSVQGVNVAPPARKRVSAQKRLDVSQPSPC